MKVSINWLRELVDLNISIEELIKLLPLRTIGVKEVTRDYFELDMKGYNRADLLSLRGVALEVAAITDSELKFKEASEDELHKNMLSHKFVSLDVKVENQLLCPLYCLVKIENLRVGPSSKEWVKKLQDSGYRSVNNVADITNLVMLEFGQPLHAFDAGSVRGRVIVRVAEKDEKIQTIDHKTRVLEESDLVIADEQKAIGIAGVMGGKDSEITNSTSTLLLEAAIFDPKNLRKTASRLGLQSEASKRFYHGLTQRRLFQALERALKYYRELGGKVTGISIVGEYDDPVKKVKLTKEKTDSLIGVKVSEKQIEEYLTRLYFTVIPLKKGIQKTWIPDQVRDDNNVTWEVTVPYFRLDVELEEDLIEEVARMYGYERLPSTSLSGEKPKEIDQSLFNLIHNIKNALVELGLTEVQTYSFYSSAVLKNLDWDKDNLVKVANPISSETEYLRTDLWLNLVEVIDKNLRQGFKDMAIFEIGKVYSPEKEKKPKESYRLSIALMNNTDHPTQELYQIFQGVKLAHIQGVLKGGGGERKYFHPNRFAFFENNRGGSIGFIAEVHPRIVNKFGVENRVAVLEIELTALL